MDKSSAFPVVVLTASLGGLDALGRVLPWLPRHFPAAVVVVQHRAADSGFVFEQLLASRSNLPVARAVAADRMQKAHVYTTAPDQHLTLTRDGLFQYSNGTRIRGARSSANPLCTSVAELFGPRAIAVVLTGGGRDATEGVQAIKLHGGTVLVQDEATARAFSMPASALGTGAVDRALPLDQIGPTIVQLVEKMVAAPVEDGVTT